MNFDNIQSIYFIGIGGIAMSATAGLAQSKGFKVSGSDNTEVYAPARDVLDKYSIDYFVGFDAERLKNNPADLYVISAGVKSENPEVEYVTQNNLPYISFPELLAYLAKDDLRVVVAGTHGKSTTSSLLGEALKGIDDSSYMVGAVIKDTESNFHAGTGHYFVFEGDEYRSNFDDPTPKFHYYKPDILVLTNLEYDHPDVFASLEEMQEEFKLMVENLPDDGIIIYNADDVALDKVLYQTNRRLFGFSLEKPSIFKVTEVKNLPNTTEITILNSVNPESIRTEKYEVKLFGKINVLNSLAVISTLRALGFTQELVQDKISQFSGIKRRFEILGESNGITVIDDYAHHPTAVNETLKVAKEKYANQKVWAVFEPHTFSRTEATIKDLATSFDSADQIIIAPIYAAREKGSNFNITDEEVKKQVSEKYPSSVFVKDKQEALDYLLKNLKPTDVVVVMAVGSFNRLGYELLEKLQNK